MVIYYGRKIKDHLKQIQANDDHPEKPYPTQPFPKDCQVALVRSYHCWDPSTTHNLGMTGTFRDGKENEQVKNPFYRIDLLIDNHLDALSLMIINVNLS